MPITPVIPMMGCLGNRPLTLLLMYVLSRLHHAEVRLEDCADLDEADDTQLEDRSTGADYGFCVCVTMLSS